MLGLAPALLAALVTASHACPPRPPVTEHRITRARWVSGAVVTEYYPIRESWFLGRAVSAACAGAIAPTGCTVRTASP